MTHLMYCSEETFSTGTWGGAVLTGFTVRCGNCEDYFAVRDKVVKRGSSIYSIAGVCELTCPYCGTKAETTPDQNYILEDTSYRGED